MSTRTVRVTGLKELEHKLDGEFLVQPELEGARDTFVKRINRQGKGLGAQQNQLTTSVRPLGATVLSTLVWPRTKGTSWGRKNEGIVKSMASRVVNKTVKRIEARWASSQSEPAGSDE